MFIEINLTLRHFQPGQLKNRFAIRGAEPAIIKLAGKIMQLHADFTCRGFRNYNITLQTQLTAAETPGKIVLIISSIFR